MPSVLITRPKASAELLAEELKGLGYQCILEPMLLISATEIPPPSFDQIAAVMITSANAIHFLKTDYLASLRQLPCFCVGPQTGEKARNFGFAQVIESHKDGLELAETIGRKLNNADHRLLHIAGRHIDSKAHTELERVGYSVTLWAIYQADPVDQLTESTQKLLDQKKLDAALFFSVRSAETFKKLLKQEGLEACCKPLIAIGLSEAITDCLKTLPWQKCIASAIPTEDAVISHLIEAVPVV